jgi:lipopolysaccharide/colanic/teichoic acid biosynthesis glycosyltransferase
MLFLKMMVAVRRVFRAAPPDDAGVLCPPQQLQRVLVRERSRAERTGEPLSVVTFTPRLPERRAAAVACLAQALRARLRITDDAGWLDEQDICAVLPATTAEGAWKVADDICARFPEKLEPPLCAVYCYPGERPRNGAAAGHNGHARPAATRATLSLEKLFLQRPPPWKHLLDVTGALLGLVVLLPLLLVLAIAVKVTSRGPVLFRQWRSGRGGRPFLIYKFRTMVADAEARQEDLRARNERDGPVFKIKDDPRVTRLGWLLRITSLDELPQLWNVLKGDMSLVGPRPLPCHETAACTGWQRRRLDVTPGLTCIWQVFGRGGVTFAEWIRMDLRYIRSLSLVQDLKLLLLTVPAVLLRRGAH